MPTIEPSDVAALLSRSVEVSVVAEKYGLSVAEVEAQLAHSRELLGVLVQSTPRRRSAPYLVAAALLAVVGGVSVAQSMCTRVDGLCVFVANQPAVAQDMNSNFTLLNDRVRQAAARAGITSYSTDGGVPAPGALVASALTVNSNASVSGNLAVGSISSTAGLAPNYDSQWIPVPAQGSDQTLPHNLGVMPRHIQVWWRESGAAFAIPVTQYDEGAGLVKGPSIAVSTTVLKFRVVDKPVAFHRFSGNGSTFVTTDPSGPSEYRFLLWK